MTQAARAATTEEKALLRTPGDWSRAYLAIYKPNVIYTARLNGAPSSTDMVGQITFDGGSGTLANVKAEMTLWVGTTSGARDLGVCRIRKAPIAGTIYIGFTSEIEWADNCYLTIVDHAILSKRPVLIDDGDILLDGEHTFSDQLIDFDPVPVLSCHAVGKLSAGEVAFVWDASHSWVFDSTISSYLWTAPGSLSIDDDTSATPTITYDTTGNHPVYCTVTAANGKSATGIQFAFRFDDAEKPHVVEVQSPSAEYNSGGWEFRVKMHADADPANVIEGALAILFAEDYYGSTQQSIGQLENRENIICWGYIADAEKIEWDAEISSVEFSVQGPHEWLGKIETNLLALQLATNTPDTWQTMPALNVDRALWFLLHWYSNATALLNITLTGDERLAPKIESAEGSLWSQMNEIAWKKIFGRIGCDRYGRFFAVIDPQCVPEADRDWANIMTLTKKDWSDRVNVERSTRRKLSMLSTSGWVVDSTASVTTLYSLSMGHISAQYGGGEIIDQLLAESQTQINELTGLYFAWKNNELEFDFTLAQNNRLVDLWPNQFLDVSLAAGDTPRGIAYTGNLIPRSITLQHDADAGCWSTEIFCEAETFAALAINGDIPTSSGIDDFDSSFPPMDYFPEIPDIPMLDFPSSVENLNLPSKVVLVSDDYGVMYSENINNGDVTKIIWKSMNAGLTPTDFALIRNVVVTPSGAVFIQTDYKVFAAAGLGGAFKEIANNTDDFDSGLIFDIALNPLKNEEIIILGADTVNATNGALGFGSYSGSTINAKSMFLRVLYPEAVVFANNKIHVFGNNGGGVFATPIVFNFDGSGGYVDYLNAIPGGDAAGRYAVAAGSQDVIFYWSHPGAIAYKVEDNASDFTLLTIGLNTKQGLSASPTGTYIMAGAWDGSNHVPKVSTDGGATWTSTSLSVGPFVWENCRDDNRWLFGGGANIKITLDRGATEVNLIGNLLYAAPLINIIGIRYLE